ncbi:helix-turn-helix domain-containing protein [Chromobacterium haemolyticum]|uniref:YdaS family helix-turn-helix protein n=1 Tax=Chromobacterium haemolyticum TaxID=394935 RepID=UPI00131879E8|nr:YdaS family helix-turn-helix protein [Chromobacterium haemolyticum]BBH12887.1 hypothetical protein CH06BL_21350 [Chromobacterium haemolyticum]
MDLKTYLFSMPQDDREQFAAKCGTTFGHLKNIAYGGRRCNLQLAIEVERHSMRMVRCESLRPDASASVGYLRGTEPSFAKTSMAPGE